jgi:hypothetical protein
MPDDVAKYATNLSAELKNFVKESVVKMYENRDNLQKLREIGKTIFDKDPDKGIRLMQTAYYTYLGQYGNVGREISQGMWSDIGYWRS